MHRGGWIWRIFWGTGLIRRVWASVLGRFLGTPFDATRTTELPRRNLKAGKLGKVIYGVEIVDGLLSKVSNCRANINRLESADKKTKRTEMPFSSPPASEIYVYRVCLFDETLSRASIV